MVFKMLLRPKNDVRYFKNRFMYHKKIRVGSQKNRLVLKSCTCNMFA